MVKTVNLAAAVALIVLAAAGCGTTRSKLAPVLDETGARTASPSGFTICYAHGCHKRAKVSLSEAEWAQVSELFAEKPATPAAERAVIARAIGVLETQVGAKTGTDADVGGSFSGMGKSGQLDCVDEMTNTTTYVQLMINAGLVTHHELGRRLTNEFFSNGNVWPHTAMTIKELASGEEWAIDSWWLKNGARPYIVTLRQWSHSDWDQPRSADEKAAAEKAGGAM